MERNNHLVLALLAILGLLLVSPVAAEESIYGHISFVDNGAAVVSADGSESQAVVNLPLLPGDTVVTPAGGRCELQFDNGTVVRLDTDSRLRLTTVLAPSLTSNWRITTLDLLQGQMYSLPQAYSREMFQVITPNAAVHLRSRTAAFIRLDAGGGTSFFSAGGKFDVMYGANARSLKKVRVKPGQPCAVSASHSLVERVEKKDIEFTAWNEYVDRHFKELHYGMNKVPPKLKFGSNALVYWAEKWSSLVGEWIYDDLFGYVWRPADEHFAFSDRPFFNADFVRINGNLFLVPQEEWGWVPAHMGTWVWLKRGWTWIPGDWFHPGIVDFQGSFTFPSFCYYWHVFHWNASPWRSGPDHPRMPRVAPGRPGLPSPVVDLIKKVERTPDADAAKRLAVGRIVPPVDGKALPPAPAPRMPAPLPDASRSGDGPGTPGVVRDWNPDNRWAARNGLSIRYSSSGNAVVCPELKLSSDKLDGVERMRLREAGSHSRSDSFSGSAVSGYPGSASGQSSNDGTADSSQGSTGEKKDD